MPTILRAATTLALPLSFAACSVVAWMLFAGHLKLSQFADKAVAMNRTAARRARL